MKTRIVGRPDMVQPRRAGDDFDLVLTAEGLPNCCFGVLVVGEMDGAAMEAIRARLDLAGPGKTGAAAIAEGLFIGGDDEAASPGRRSCRLNHGGER
jgi:hypothetical protein